MIITLMWKGAKAAVAGVHAKNRQATDELIALVSKARSIIDIENPCFIPTSRWRTALKDCLVRGVKIRLLTNSTYTNDLPIR